MFDIIQEELDFKGIIAIDYPNYIPHRSVDINVGAVYTEGGEDKSRQYISREQLVVYDLELVKGFRLKNRKKK